MNWLAPELAQQGYIVAAPDHPGTTTFNKDADQAAKLWERPHDLSRVIDVLTTDPKLAGKVDIGVGSGWGRNDTLSVCLRGPKIFAGQQDMRPAQRRDVG